MSTGIKIFLLFGIIVAIVAIITYSNRTQAPSTELVNEVKREHHPVHTVIVQPATLTQNLERTGVLQANLDVIITAEVGGRIKNVFKDLGDRCRKGESLLQLDKENYQIALSQAKAQLAQGEANLEQAVNNLNRLRRLKDGDIIAAEKQESAESQFKSSAAMVEQLKAGIRLAQKNLRETNVECPFSGLIAELLVDVGQSIRTTTPLARLVNVDKLKLTIDVSASILNRLEVGRRVVLTDPSLPDSLVNAEVTRLGVAANDKTRTFPVEITTNDPERRLRPGQIVNASCEVRVFKDVLSLPIDSISFEGDESSVFVVENDVAKKITVQVGAKIDEKAIILSGLKPGDEVVVVGAETLKNGSSVKVVNQEREPPGSIKIVQSQNTLIQGKAVE
ncbi:MAG: efflux RND transporter periplasmic adaptor subunit [Deltaproteobacteria bacterium]|nr:efflux RND transporter periplasmic adaptor subunit [Deltaproteobacteria bacterium]